MNLGFEGNGVPVLNIQFMAQHREVEILLKRVGLVVGVIIAGLVTGYFSSPIRNFIFNPGISKPGIVSAQKTVEDGTDTAAPDFISKEDAIGAVKNLPAVSRLVRVSELDGTQLVFAADQEPTDEYPVWLVEVKESRPDKLPETIYYQVDAVSGGVLDFREDELQISGLGLGMTRKEVELKQGKPSKNKKLFDKTLQQNVRVYSYPGLEVVFGSKGSVIKITASQPDYTGPKGVKTGDIKKDVIRTLGKAGTAQSDRLAYSFGEDKNLLFVVKFSNDSKVSEISIEKTAGSSENK